MPGQAFTFIVAIVLGMIVLHLYRRSAERSTKRRRELHRRAMIAFKKRSAAEQHRGVYVDELLEEVRS